MKIAVVGGGSTYTPELVSGLSRERERLPVEELVLHDIDAERREVVGGWRRRMLDAQGFDGSLSVTDDLDRALDGARLRARADPRGRADSAALGRDGAARLRLHRPGDDRRRRLREGPAHGARRARDRRARTRAWPPRSLDRRLHESRSASSPARCSTPDIARWASATSRSGSSAGSRGLHDVDPARVLVDQVGLNHLTWIRRCVVDGADVPPGAPRRARRRGRRAGRAPSAHADRRARRRSRRPTCTTSTATTRFSRSSARARRGRRRWPRSSASCSSCTATRRLVEKPALLEQRGGAFYSEAATALVASLAAGTGDVQVVDVRNGERDPRPRGRRRRRAPGDGSTRTGPCRSRSPRSRRSSSVSSSTSRRTSVSPREAAVTRDAVTARKALLTHPLIGQSAIAGRARRAAARRRADGSRERAHDGPVVLAVDGGNSKTDLALVRVRRARCSPTCAGRSRSPHHLGLGRVRRSAARHARRCGLGREARRATARRVAEIAEIFLAGVDFPAEERRAASRRSRRATGPRARPSATTPSPSCAPGTARGWGVAVVCGAGINCVGVAPDGRHLRFPALGAITGDWGGGYDVGLAALSAAARSEDGRGPATSLERAVPAHFRAADAARARARRSTAGGSPNRRLIELAPVVFAEAADDDVAAGIVERLAAEIVALARVAITRLDLGREPVEVLLGGGLLRAGDGRLLGAIEAGLREVGDQIVVHRTASPPIVGAALFGLDALGADEEAQTSASARSSRRPWTPTRSSEWPTEEMAMADVRFEHATRIYPGSDVPGRRPARPPHRGRRVHGPRRPVGLGEVDRVAHARRARGRRRRRHLGRRPRRHVRAPEGPRRRHGVPELRPLPVPHRRREHRLPAEDGEDAPRRARPAGARGGGDAGSRRPARAKAGPAVGRPAAAGRDGARDRAPARAST